MNILKIQEMIQSSPETARPRPQGWRMAPFLISDALSTEMLCQEMKFICRGLKGQLVQLLLRWAWWLSTEKNTEKKCTKRMHRGQLMNGRGTDSARHWALQRKRKLFIRPGASLILLIKLSQPLHSMTELARSGKLWERAREPLHLILEPVHLIMQIIYYQEAERKAREYQHYSGKDKEVPGVVSNFLSFSLMLS